MFVNMVTGHRQSESPTPALSARKAEMTKFALAGFNLIRSTPATLRDLFATPLMRLTLAHTPYSSGRTRATRRTSAAGQPVAGTDRPSRPLLHARRQSRRAHHQAASCVRRQRALCQAPSATPPLPSWRSRTSGTSTTVTSWAVQLARSKPIVQPRSCNKPLIAKPRSHA